MIEIVIGKYLIGFSLIWLVSRKCDVPYTELPIMFNIVMATNKNIHINHNLRRISF